MQTITLNDLNNYYRLFFKSNYIKLLPKDYTPPRPLLKNMRFNYGKDLLPVKQILKNLENKKYELDGNIVFNGIKIYLQLKNPNISDDYVQKYIIDNKYEHNINYFIRTAYANDNHEIIKKIEKNKIPTTYQIYNKKDGLVQKLTGNNNDLKITLMNCGTSEAIRYWFLQGKYPCALNFANSFHPGGGYTTGDNAQEENLCLKSGFLYASLNEASSRNKYYEDWGKNWDNKVLYTPLVPFVRDEEEKLLNTKFIIKFNDGNQFEYNINTLNLLNQNTVYSGSIITSAAPDFRTSNPFGKSFDTIIRSKRNIDYDSFKKELETYVKKNKYLDTIRYICMTPSCIHNCSGFPNVENIGKPRVLILGAWGCGAFNPPSSYSEYRQIIAEYFIEVLKTIPSNTYDEIVFAIPGVPDKDINYTTFKTVFNDNLKKGNLTELDNNTINKQIKQQQMGGNETYYYKYQKYKQKYIELKNKK